MTVKGYVEKVQSTLSDVGFQKFKKSMFEYKKVQGQSFKAWVDHNKAWVKDHV